MWKQKLDKIIQEKSLYREKVNKGATQEEIQILRKSIKTELNVDLPIEYIKSLEIVNGLEFNGFIFYGIDGKLLNDTPNQHISGLLEYNKVWYENEWQKQYIFLGESNISWYVYDLKMKQYYELDSPSGSKIEEFSSFDCLLEKMLSDSLL